MTAAPREGELAEWLRIARQDWHRIHVMLRDEDGAGAGFKGPPRSKTKSPHSPRPFIASSDHLASNRRDSSADSSGLQMTNRKPDPIPFRPHPVLKR